MNTKNPELLTLSETHLTRDVDQNETLLPNYSQIAFYSDSKLTSGIIIYYKHNWDVTKIFEKIVSKLKFFDFNMYGKN